MQKDFRDPRVVGFVQAGVEGLGVFGFRDFRGLRGLGLQTEGMKSVDPEDANTAGASFT